MAWCRSTKQRRAMTRRRDAQAAWHLRMFPGDVDLLTGLDVSAARAPSTALRRLGWRPMLNQDAWVLGFGWIKRVYVPVIITGLETHA